MNSKKRDIVQKIWVVFMLISAVALLYLTLNKGISIAADHEGSWTLALWLVALAFLAEYVDSSLGMGYGTVLTPVLLIFGFSPLQVVPAILFSEFLTGVTAGLYHHKVGNVHFGKNSEARKIVKIIILFSVFGTTASVLIAVNLPKFYVKLYIAAMLLSIGFFVTMGKKILGQYSSKKIMGLGAVAAFNKGISGGGYGPLVTGGQVILGVKEKHAVGITSLAEGIVCSFGLALYAILSGFPFWSLAIPLCVGGLLSVPVSVWTVKILPDDVLRKFMGYATFYLGILALIKILW